MIEQFTQVPIEQLKPVDLVPGKEVVGLNNLHGLNWFVEFVAKHKFGPKVPQFPHLLYDNLKHDAFLKRLLSTGGIKKDRIPSYLLDRSIPFSVKQRERILSCLDNKRVTILEPNPHLTRGIDHQKIDLDDLFHFLTKADISYQGTRVLEAVQGEYTLYLRPNDNRLWLNFRLREQSHLIKLLERFF